MRVVFYASETITVEAESLAEAKAIARTRADEECYFWDRDVMETTIEYCKFLPKGEAQ